MENPFAITAIDHIVIATPDLSVLQAFYERVLGCHVERTLPEIGLVQMRAGRAMIDLVQLQEGGVSGRNMEHFCLMLADWDVQAIKAHLDRHDVCFDGLALRYGATGMGPSIYITDPDGNTIEIKGPAPAL